MMENIKQEALLRHLLSRENCEDDDFVYSFLLGSRLFLSPHQLLTELHRLSTELTSSDICWKSPEKFCLKCREMQTKITDVPMSSSNCFEGTDFRANKMLSATFVTSGLSDDVVPEGEETIRRRRRGRRRNQADFESNPDPNSLHVNCSSTISRDSGILSAVLETLDMDSSNHMVAEKTVLAHQLGTTCNDSGYIIESDAETSCSGCMKQLQREASIRSKRQLILVLREWVRHFPADFRNKKTRWTLNDVIRSCKADNEDISALCTEVVDCISRRTATQESYEQQLNDLDVSKGTKSIRKTKNWMVKMALKLKHSRDVNDVAQQLCLIEMELLKHVGAEEFLQLFTEDGEEDVRTNLGACVRWFNRLSRLVATLVCMCRKRKHARHVITFYARVANRCFELSNFNSSMAILTGLSFGPVTRLKKTWNKLVLSELTKLQNVFDPSNNFLKYRSAYTCRVEQLHSPTSLHGVGTNRCSLMSQHSIGSVSSSHHVDSGVECDNETPSPTSPSPLPQFQTSMKHFNFDPKTIPNDGVMVPFLVLLVKDVYFLNHAIHTVDEQGNINFEKLRNLSNILRPLEEWKKMSSPYQIRDSIKEFFLQAPVQDDRDLYLLSYKRESPTNRFEKQQLKTLKSERDLKRKSEILNVKARCETV